MSSLSPVQMVRSVKLVMAQVDFRPGSNDAHQARTVHIASMGNWIISFAGL